MTFTIFSSDDPIEDINNFYNVNGLVIIRQTDDQLFLDNLQHQIEEVINLKLKLLNLKPINPLDNPLHHTIMQLAQYDREQVSHVYDAINTLPALAALNNDRFIQKCLQIMGRTPYNMMDVARLRMDFPNESQYMTTEHQESFYHDVPESSLNFWIPVTDVDDDMGPLMVRKGSHKLGRLPTVRKEQRPFFFLQGGAWQDDFTQQAVTCKKGDVVIFHNHLIHTGGLNTGNRPRVSVQIRFNWLDDPQYKSSGWPRSYQIKQRHEKEITYKYS